MFKVGQKVVCVEPNGRNLFKGEIYTIIAIRKETDGLMLLEASALNDYGYSGFFNSKRFRPLDHAFDDEVIKMICEQPETVEA